MRQKTKCTRRTGQGQHPLDRTLEVEEIQRSPGLAPLFGAGAADQDRGQTFALLGRITGFKHAADLEQTHAVLLPRLVSLQCFDQAGQQTGPHHRELHRQRVGERHRIRGQAPAIERFGSNKTEVQGLHEAIGNQAGADFSPADLGFTGHAQGDFAARRVFGNGVVTVDAGDFLDQVFLDGDVEALARRGHRPALGRVLDFHAE